MMRNRQTTRKRLPARTALAGELPVHRLRMVYNPCMMRTNVSTELPQAAFQLLKLRFCRGLDQRDLGFVRLRPPSEYASCGAGLSPQCQVHRFMSVKCPRVGWLTRSPARISLDLKARSDLRSSKGAPGGPTVLILQNIAWHAAIRPAVSPRNAQPLRSTERQIREIRPGSSLTARST
jgi:hypothetical protein